MDTAEPAAFRSSSGYASDGPDNDLGHRGQATEMLSELIQYRELLWQMTLRDLRVRYKQAVMGFGWAILMPILIVAAGFLIKYAMARMAGTTLRSEDLAGMAVKAVPWAFFVGAIGFATTSLTSNLNLVTKIYFPREVFPLSAVLTQTFDSAFGSISVVLLVFTALGVRPSVQLLWALPLGLLMFLLTSAAGLLLSCGNLFFRDVKYLVQIFLTFGIFFTPVLYDASLFGPVGCPLMMLNPLAPLLEGIRLAVVDHHNLALPLMIATNAGDHVMAWHPGYLLYTGIWAVIGGWCAWWMFHSLEFVYAEYA